MGFLTRLRSHVTCRRDHPSVVTATRSLSYGALLELVEAGRRDLSQRGVGPGAVVGVLLRDEVEHLVASLALLASGAAHVTLASHDPAPVRTALSKRVHVTHVLIAEPHPSVEGVTSVRWDELTLGQTPAAQETTLDAEGMLYLKTSGTTGDTNIVPFSQTQIGAQAGRHEEYRDERLLRLASIEHNNSKRHRLYCVWAGGTNVFKPTTAFDIVDFCTRYAVTCMDISRMHVADLAANPEAQGLAGIKLRTGGSAVPGHARRQIEERVTRRLYVRYGATECGAISMAGPNQHDADDPVGVPCAGVEVEIVGRSVPARVGETGEIRVRAPGMATGYLDSPDDTAKRFRDGWFHPGDLGILRSDGQLVVLGRTDDMILLNGVNIFPAEIEQVLESHVGVNAAAALPLPSAVHGQIPVAAVELRSGSDVAPAELLRYAREHLSLRAPRRILVMDQLPRNGQGKIMRCELVRVFRAGTTPHD